MRIPSTIRTALTVGCALGLTWPLFADEPLRFNRDVRPILSEHCFKCHGPDGATRKADLRLDNRDWADGRLEADEVLDRLTSTDPDLRMPPAETGSSLSTSQVSLIRRWLEEDATYEKHWSYIPPKRPPLPKVSASDSEFSNVTNPIDRFVLARLHQEGMRPSPKADRRTLLRRTSFDLLGLPPSVELARAFVKDQSESAFETIVDEMLASPHYGEHMAQGWLDGARYADTTGYAADKPRTMWLYRDWVIKAFNANMPFDQFTVEQLAGDMLPDATIDQRVATGFHRNSMQALGNNPRKEEFRVKGIVDRIDTTGRVWLGATLACAECHDHKYDPITQQEYYELFAIFNNVPHLGEKFEIHGPRIQVDVPGHGRVTAQVMQELAIPRKTHIHVRGNFENLGKQVFAGTPNAMNASAEHEATNRLEFARWLVDGKNPLVARIAVNRIWAHFFGRGIVRTMEDFGSQGAWPSHPDLLDWLAVEFVESGWNVQHIQKLIVMSDAYQQSSKATAEDHRRDPDNRWVSRGPRHRLSAEQIRDFALSVSNLLNRKIGGPSVYPQQPSHIGEFRDDTAGEWKTSTGSDRHRRGVYTFWQRMYPYPSLQIFDAPSRERCVVRRERSNTPLQALVALNDPAFVEMSQAFADRTMAQKGSDQQRIEFAFECALTRLPNEKELRMFQELLDRQRTRSREGRFEAAESERAAWTMVASTLLNLDEAISKQ